MQECMVFRASLAYASGVSNLAWHDPLHHMIPGTYHHAFERCFHLITFHFDVESEF
jgi:hypothetical protein